MAGQELASRVTSSKSYEWSRGSIDLAAPIAVAASAARSTAGGSDLSHATRAHSSEAKQRERRHRVVAYDFGIKQNILRLLVDHGCDVTVVPAKTSAEDVLALKPDGVFLSNGPGDPEPVTYAVANIRKLLGRTPIFRNLPGPSALRTRSWGQDFQIEIRASRRKSSGKEFAYR